MIRFIRTQQERRLSLRDKKYTRAKRNKTNLPSAWDTQWITIPKSWKDLYKKQCQWEDAQVKQSYQNGMEMSSQEIVDYRFNDGDWSPRENSMDFEQHHVWADEEYEKEWNKNKTKDSWYDNWFFNR